MATIIMGHGNRIDGEAKTFLPGDTSISFYGDTDKLLPTTLALAAVASGGLGSPNETFGAGDEIWNYHLYKEDDQGIAQYMQLDPGGNTMVFVGPDVANNTPLCTDVLACQQHGDHTCDGILGKYRGDLVVLACRGIKGQANATSRAFGSDSDDPLADLGSELDQWVTGFIGRVKADPDAAEAEFDNLPEGTKTMLSPYTSIAAWSQARWVRYYADQGDFTGFVGQVNTSTVDKAALQRWLAEVPVYADALLFLIVTRMRQTFDEMVSAGQAGATDTEMGQLAQQAEARLERAKSTVESLLGFPVDQSRLATYGPSLELKAYVEQTLQALQEAETQGQPAQGEQDQPETETEEVPSN